MRSGIIKKIKRRAVAVIAVIIVLTVIAPVQVWAARVGSTEISSRGAVVIDYDTGILLYGHNESRQMVPASMIKVLAAYVIYDAVKAGEISFDTNVRISKSTSELSYDREYSNVPLKEGSSYKLRLLMETVLIRSACAATVAMGDALCGNEKAFIARMKEKATDLGVETRIYDSWGASPNNRISPLGMAVLTRGFIMEHPEVLNITSKRSVTFEGVTYNNSNLLLGQYTGIDGFKTGFTDPAGYCLSATAKQGGRRIISVTMGSTLQSRYPDTRALLNYGFSTAEKTIAEYNRRNYANPSKANLILDGEQVPLSAYIINDSHYFKLRDIAFLLGGTQKQFQVTWSSVDNTVNLTSGVPYTADGSEMSFPFEGARPYNPTPSVIYYNGVAHELEAYLIDGYNYFKLRDLGRLMEFVVNWEGATSTVIIRTGSGNTVSPAVSPDSDLNIAA